ncbi:MAG: hypothetical protein NTW96_02595 [Planctomycetia bacterium]|nr:hypothetical protein [Planctomycetia bacterium]
MNVRGATPRVVAVLLVLSGAVCVGLRFQARRDVRLGRGDSVWRLTYRIECDVDKAGANLRAAFPWDTPHSRVFREDFRSSGLTIGPRRLASTGTREVLAVAQEPGHADLTVRFDLHLSPTANWSVQAEPTALSVDTRARYLGSEPAVQTTGSAVIETLKRWPAAPATQAELVQRLFEYCQTQIGAGWEDAPSDAESALREGVATASGRARAMVALCRASKVPARLVTGFEIREGDEVPPQVWVEVLTGARWLPYDPTNGFAEKLPYNFVPARRDAAQVLLTSDVSAVEAVYSIVRLPGAPEGMAVNGGHVLDILDLTRLPLEMHEVLSLILLMPLGAVVTCIFRTIIGVKTSGTFTPTLLALSFVFADWRTGLLVFVAVIALGFTTRKVLDWLKLLMLPRLSIVLTLVVCCIVFAVSALDYLRLTPGSHAVLLPMVILTMIVERFYVTSQEDGLRVAIQLLAGTVLVGFFCYLVLRWESVARLLLAYPEGHFFTVAVLILIGRYTGYQLLEPWRFRDVADMEP